MHSLDGGEALAKVLYHYGLLDGEGEFKIVCPFHDDINASMKINLLDGSFYCFGCNISGDALKFVKLVNKLDDLQACIEMFRIMGSEEVQSIKVQRKAKPKSEEKQLLVEAEDYYFGLKTIDWRNEPGPERDYMANRGFNPSILTNCKAKLTYNNAYPIIFPMFDMNEFRGWVCRTMDKRIEEKRKYLYNTGFSRRNTLVGNYRGKIAMLVEGYMDWLKMRQFGVKNVAAILGWKLTEQQITKLKNAGVEIIISALDNDPKGKEGTEYAKKFFDVIAFQFPVGIKDPGDLDKTSFGIANEKTKQLYRRHISNGIGRRYQKPGEKIRSK